MSKRVLEYVHVIDKKSRKSIEAIGPSANAERVARGVSINLDHEKYELAVSPSKEWP